MSPKTRNFNELRERARSRDAHWDEQVIQRQQAMEDALALAELRQSRHVTQIRLAEELGISQGNVSRLEGRSDVYLSTLRSYIQALGGQLEITAVFGKERIPLAPGSRSGDGHQTR
jgi:DNA-binding Xre family transcriptional regulator